MGSEGVHAIAQAHVLVIGAGGTGCGALTALAAAGVGRITLNDFDTVDVSNLARQTLFTDAQVGCNKATAARQRLRKLRPAMPIDVIPHRMDGEQLRAAIARSSIVLDCTDNFQSRLMINAACVATNTTLVSGSAIRWEAQLAVFGPEYTNSPCYACIYTDADESLDDCDGAGVLASLPATVGTLMAGETIKVLVQPRTATTLTLFDALENRWQTLAVPKNPNCAECATTSPQDS